MKGFNLYVYGVGAAGIASALVTHNYEVAGQLTGLFVGSLIMELCGLEGITPVQKKK